MSEGVETLPISMFLSSTSSVAVLTVVVGPFTTRSPPTVTLPVVVTADGESKPVLELKAKFVPDLTERFPVAPSAN